MPEVNSSNEFSAKHILIAGGNHVLHNNLVAEGLIPESRRSPQLRDSNLHSSQESALITSLQYAPLMPMGGYTVFTGL